MYEFVSGIEYDHFLVPFKLELSVALLRYCASLLLFHQIIINTDFRRNH